MSLLAKRIGLIVLSALIIFSCKEKEKIGIGLPQDNEIGVHYSDTFTIATKATLKNDSIVTSGQGYLYAGAFADPKFGNISAEAYTQLLLKYENKDAFYSSVDSVVMTLTYDYQYGDTNQFQTINAFRVTDDMGDLNKTYFSVSPPLTKDPTLLDNDVQFKAKPITGTQKVYLTNTFGTDMLDIIGAGSSTANFVSNFKGLALVPKNPNEGAVLRIKLFDNTSSIKVYYKNLSAVNDSLVLLMTASGARYSRITSDRSSVAVLNGLITSGDYSNANGDVYIQSGLGIRTKLQFPGLANFKNAVGNVAINKAELYFEVDPADVNPFFPVGFLTLIKLDNTGNIRKYLGTDGVYHDMVVQQNFTDVAGTTAPLTVSYITSTNSYTASITSYINAVLYGLEENNGLIVATHPDINRTSVNRTHIQASKVKLKIYYTQVE